MHRRLAAHAVGYMHVGLELEQQARDLWIVARAGPRKRRHTTAVGHVGAGARGQQQPHGVDVAVDGGRV